MRPPVELELNPLGLSGVQEKSDSCEFSYEF